MAMIIVLIIFALAFVLSSPGIFNVLRTASAIFLALCAAFVWFTIHDMNEMAKRHELQVSSELPPGFVIDK